jgi:DNA processing protein
VTEPLSPNSQAILLLTAPLLLGRGVPIERPLGPDEYATLASALHQRQFQPADCLSGELESILHECQTGLDEERIRRLLARGFLLGQALERWRGRAIWVLTRADSAYPRALKARLRSAAPPILYGCGDTSLLLQGGLLVLGGRTDTVLAAYGDAMGERLAQAGVPALASGESGLDRRVLRAALARKGHGSMVLSNSLERAVLEPANRDAITDGRLLLVSPFDPAATYDGARLAEQNRLLCGLADALLVRRADPYDDTIWPLLLERLALAGGPRVYVDAPIGVAPEDEDPALATLVARGARSWPHAQDSESLRAALREQS